MDEINNTQGGPIQTPEPTAQNEQPNIVTNSTTKKHGFNKKIGILIAVFVLLLGGGATYVVTKNKLNPQAAGGGAWNTLRMGPTFWDDKVHTETKECMINTYVCHSNGSLIFLGGSKKGWRSDPAKNSTGVKLSSPTWDGPYGWSPGPYYNDYYTITGNQRLCFLLKDVSKTGSAKIAIVVRNSNSIYDNYPAKTLTSVQGTLKSTFKKKYQNVCVNYYNPYTVYGQTYRLYVKSGQVEIERAARTYQAYYYNYTPYTYDVRGNLLGATSAAKTSSAEDSYTCSSLQSKSTDKCSTESQAKASDVAEQLTELKSVNSSDVQE